VLGLPLAEPVQHGGMIIRAIAFDKTLGAAVLTRNFLRQKGYTQSMNEIRETSPAKPEHDPSLIAWFVSLSPDERLAELESRVAFFHSLRSTHDAQLSRDSGSSQSTPG
jgi:hypothetical protein